MDEWSSKALGIWCPVSRRLQEREENEEGSSGTLLLKALLFLGDRALHFEFPFWKAESLYCSVKMYACIEIPIQIPEYGSSSLRHIVHVILAS